MSLFVIKFFIISFILNLINIEIQFFISSKIFWCVTLKLLRIIVGFDYLFALESRKFLDDGGHTFPLEHPLIMVHL